MSICASTQHIYDTQATARERITFDTPKEAALDLRHAQVEGPTACGTTTPHDIWEQFRVPATTSTELFTIHLYDIPDSLTLSLEVVNAADSLVYCSSSLSTNGSISLLLDAGQIYWARYYGVTTDSIDLSFRSGYSHPQGIDRCPDDTELTFVKQSELDNYTQAYPYCDDVSSLAIGGTVSSLSGLEALERVNQGLEIESTTQLQSLAGLHNVKACNILDINYNQHLQSISALSSLEVVHGSMSLSFNPRLQGDVYLSSLKEVGKRVFIFLNDSLPHLQLLQSVDQIGTGLFVQNNGLLTSLSGLDEVDYIGGDLRIDQNPSLTDYSALSELDTIQGKLSLTNVQGAVNLNFLQSLKYVGGQFTISSNSTLETLNGLQALSHIDGGLFITDNTSLVSLSGLSSLLSIDGPLRISGNDALGELGGLTQLKEIDGFLDISENDNLFSLAGLENIDPRSIKSITWNFNDLTIRDNPMLTTCHAPAICDALNLTTLTYTIVGNAPGCLDKPDITQYCFAPVLPVEGWIITANAEDHDVQISWTTEREINCASYTVSRLDNSLEWIDIGHRPCHRDRPYSYVDHDVPSGKHYYQLVQTDYDGTQYHSDILDVYVEPDKSSAPYPNPTTGHLQISLLSDYTVYDITGNRVLFGHGSVVDLGDLPSGIYHLQYGDQSARIVRL